MINIWKGSVTVSSKNPQFKFKPSLNPVNYNLLPQVKDNFLHSSKLLF